MNEYSVYAIGQLKQIERMVGLSNLADDAISAAKREKRIVKAVAGNGEASERIAAKQILHFVSIARKALDRAAAA